MPRFFMLLLACCWTQWLSTQELFTIKGEAQGTYYIIKYVAVKEVNCRQGIDTIFNKMDASLSLYKPGSLINRFNEQGDGVRMDSYMAAVLRKSLEVYKISGGLFDITVKPLVDAWGFGVKRHREVPKRENIREILKHVGSRYLLIDGDSLLKKKPGVQIDCNGIAQGYTVDVICEYLSSLGIENYLVDVGGELRSKGKNPKNRNWTIGIERPESDGDRVYPSMATIVLNGQGVATSGNYRRFFDEGEIRYTHTINPKTGEALHHKVISVTVVAPDCITADAYDNVFFLMGVEKGLKFARQHPELKLAVHYVFKDGNGQTREKYSAAFEQLLLKK
ncbi:thiamine biosynthesis protein ApbE [Chitinophaga caeni]|uniref:FAD:protein FMN transferase n=1 Tax=Chitinophaga caeni TaxID=2029983 RepID=A0A291QV41_9BACT|nr:FAD:protein FMN transferase [Chitinophaga caeni]ATL47714.1 thiamine biosynthesis protein ApbE [Chitinophaga caeni]